ncbi:uncharacterized protein IL334_003914 [Kwoniella shivajii]|uniref:Protein CPL1-like domain-containing protein n=1 Tax=Kwoniella shivajii TaxID=564305 RepID=A0ABZ1D0Q8_9TREE|nr:hypothetical protein IL334_003914 [Kwoniella shivajii]
MKHTATAAVLSVLFRSAYAYVYVGCFDPQILPEQDGLLYDDYLDDCPDLCRVNGTAYSYSWPNPEDQGDFPTTRICQCGNIQPSGIYLIPTSLCDYPFVEVYYLPSPGDWSYSGCLYNGTFVPNPVDDLVECLIQCAGFPTAYVLYIDSTISCSCSWDLPDPEALQTICGIGDLVVYSETVLPSSFARISATSRKFVAKGDELCPRGLRACSVWKSTEMAYEKCIDLETELESSGGCLHGQLEMTSGLVNVITRTDTNKGVDCASLQGVRPDGVTCLSGACLIFACEEEYTLQNNLCLPR